MSKKWLINVTEESDMINATLDNGRGLKKNLFGVSFFLRFKLLENNLKYVKFKLLSYQDLFHTRSNIKDGESGIC